MSRCTCLQSVFSGPFDCIVSRIVTGCVCLTTLIYRLQRKENSCHAPAVCADNVCLTAGYHRVLYVCVLYFMAGFQKTPGKPPLHVLTYLRLKDSKHLMSALSGI